MVWMLSVIKYVISRTFSTDSLLVMGVFRTTVRILWVGIKTSPLFFLGIVLCLGYYRHELTQNILHEAAFFSDVHSFTHHAYLNLQQQSGDSQLRAHLLRLSQLKTYDMVLDIGCGDGRLVTDIGKSLLEGKVFGLDKSQVAKIKAQQQVQWRMPKATARAQTIVGDISVEEGAVDRLPASLFDKVVHLNSMMFWEDLEVAVDHIYRLARPGALLVGVEQMEMAGRVHAELNSNGYHSAIKHTSMDQYIALLEAAGFEAVAYSPHTRTGTCPAADTTGHTTTQDQTGEGSASDSGSNTCDNASNNSADSHCNDNGSTDGSGSGSDGNDNCNCKGQSSSSPECLTSRRYSQAPDPLLLLDLPLYWAQSAFATSSLSDMPDFGWLGRLLASSRVTILSMLLGPAATAEVELVVGPEGLNTPLAHLARGWLGFDASYDVVVARKKQPTPPVEKGEEGGVGEMGGGGVKLQGVK